MARIPDEEIERLKQEISLERMVTARGITLRRHGADLIGLCPFHPDREPSLILTPSKNLWLCGAPHNQSYAEHSIMRS